MRRRAWLRLCMALAGFTAATTWAADLVLIDDGAAKAAIWCSEADKGATSKSISALKSATVLADHLQQITGVAVPVKRLEKDGKPDANAPAIIVGSLALEMGCPKPPKSNSDDGYRVRRQGNRLFLVGESPASTFFAVSHFLETLGCRWFFDNAIGTVIPKMKTVAVGALDLEEKPDFLYRALWGPNWRGGYWKEHNRIGGRTLGMGHAWGQTPPKEYFAEHPEYYSMDSAGNRRKGRWVCTSNEDVRRIFAEKISAQVKGKGYTSVSLSPPDGTRFCQCDKCRAQDVPNYLEPSSGSVVVSDRYQLFYNAIAKEVKKTNPDAILCFYAYSDYSKPPIQAPRGPDNLCTFVAPIRFCRHHALDSPMCPPRQRLRNEVLAGWSKVVSKIGWRTYNYNLAECTVPFSKLTIFKSDFSYLHKIGCIGVNLECFAQWHIYGPHTYAAARMLWDVDLDLEALMDDFYTKFCGKAAPYVKSYWERIDRAYRETNAHAGSYFAVHYFWTPEVVKASQADLDAALKAADTDLIRQRVEMFQMGLDNAKYYLALRDATNRCDFVEAKGIYDRLLANMDKAHQKKIHRIGEYKYGYVPRFLGRNVEAAYASVTGAGEFLAQLPNKWWFRYDYAKGGEEYKPQDKGAQTGWTKDDYQPDKDWRQVETYTSTLTDQGVPEELTWMWYRCDFQLDKIPAGKRLNLFFTEVDGLTTMVAVNGELAGWLRPKRRAASVNVTGKLRVGKNTVVVATNHARISELMLGGILKPVMVTATDEALEAKLLAEAAAKKAAEAAAKKAARKTKKR